MSGADPLRVERVIHAPREDVFDAWTDPARLRTWWGPPSVPVSRLDGELRPGGDYRIVMVEPSGDERSRAIHESGWIGCLDNLAGQH
jgi:uncharacterized protein YndB with AHSA1/START domain